jgi:hypothetical protein
MLFPEDPQTATDSQLTCRRGVLGTLGLAGLGLLAGTNSAAAFTDIKKSGSMPKVSVPTSSQNTVVRSVPFVLQPDLPEEWASLHVREANDYFRYLNKLGLKRVSPAQVVATHAKSRGNVWNTLPPRVWWKRMGYTLRLVERIALEMNVGQVEVISAYRAPAYNANCEGARTGSWHQANIAVDVKFPVRASKVTSTARELRDLGLFKGGVGGYWDFTHIDCRGENINW